MPLLEDKIPTPSDDTVVYRRCQDKLSELLRCAPKGRWVPKRLNGLLPAFGRSASTFQLFPKIRYHLVLDLPDDLQALGTDWSLVGADLYSAILKYADENRTHEPSAGPEDPGETDDSSAR